MYLETFRWYDIVGTRCPGSRGGGCVGFVCVGFVTYRSQRNNSDTLPYGTLLPFLPPSVKLREVLVWSLDTRAGDSSSNPRSLDFS